MQLSGRNDEDVAGADSGLYSVDIGRVGINVRHDHLDRGVPVRGVILVLNVVIYTYPAERGHNVFSGVAPGERITWLVYV